MKVLPTPRDQLTQQPRHQLEPLLLLLLLLLQVAVLKHLYHMVGVFVPNCGILVFESLLHVMLEGMLKCFDFLFTDLEQELQGVAIWPTEPCTPP
jgi:hypothetical protein